MVQGIGRKKISAFLLVLPLVFLLGSCSRLLGYGILLWSTEEPAIPSGTVLPVYIRSNIDRVWVAGIPKQFQDEESRVNKFEIPLSKLRLAGSKKKAQAQAEAFAPFARIYAETLQDGLPIRGEPDNGARRVYRLKQGEVVKVLSKAEGTTAVGATGDPLPGEWYRVLTEDGVAGFCFSYRLSFFEHTAGPLAVNREGQEAEEDPELEKLLDRAWSPESYGIMVASQKINLEELSNKWYFDPGQETGIARIKTNDLDLSFPYSKIRSTGTLSWRFEGTGLQMNLRTENTLAVQFTETNGVLRTTLFVALPSTVDDIILQETARREEQYRSLYEQGPVYFSTNYGTLTFAEDGHFTWTGKSSLTPDLIPPSALESGVVEMRLFLDERMSERYHGAFTLRFNQIGGAPSRVDFMYGFDSQGLRLEHVPDTSLDDITVVRRASSPMLIYFNRAERPGEIPGMDFPPLPPIPFPEDFPPPGEPGSEWNGAPDFEADYPPQNATELPPGNPPQALPENISEVPPELPPEIPHDPESID